MSLQSQLFRGDARLEAAATSDADHIMRGAIGEHVRKIQNALIQLDGASIGADGKYGPGTATAVQAYKRKRNIVNTSYQSQPDDIVGKMTMASLDAELVEAERAQGPVQLTVISPAPLKLDHVPFVHFNPRSNRSSKIAVADGGSVRPNILPGPVVSINAGHVALLKVTNGQGATITSSDDRIAAVRDPVTKAGVQKITSDPHEVEVIGNRRGGVVIVVDKHARTLSLPESMFMASVTVSVRQYRSTPYVETMKPHNHRPVKDWEKLLSDIRQPTDTAAGWALAALIAVRAAPMTFINAAIAAEFNFKPVALQHLNWYLRDGRGQELNEDFNIEKWVRSDWGIRKRIRRFMEDNKPKGPRHHGFIVWEHYQFANEDYKYAYGTIDRLDIELDWVLKTVKIWFKDSYEWHPVCDGYYQKFPDDVVRVNNSLHAALVQVKNQGAADYWMLGEATFPMSFFGYGK
jgi:peptidoglycan hydrolase-like protein with peptidoglycan-binding domain